MNWFRNYASGLPGMGLLFLRLFMGYAMMTHGFGKIQSPFHWMDKMPGHPPGFLQALGAMGEFFGGMGLLFGALTPLAALGVMSTMFVAFLQHMSGPGPHFLIKPQGAPEGADVYEDVAFYFMGALTLFLTGPGLLSIDAILFGRNRVSGNSASTAPFSTPATKR